MQTFRSKLIASFIGSIVVFLLLSVSTQSAYEAFRNADFSEQETTIVRDCNHDDLSKLIFKKIVVHSIIRSTKIPTVKF